MAAVAKRCGFTTMSLYRHVASKDELVRRMLDATLGTAPPLGTTDWREGLARWSCAMLEILDRHPWGDRRADHRHARHARAALVAGPRARGAGGDRRSTRARRPSSCLLLNGYVFWAARLRFQVPDDEALEVVPSDFDLSPFPSLARALAAGIFEDESRTRDEDFTFGLERVLDGIAALIEP